MGRKNQTRASPAGIGGIATEAVCGGAPMQADVASRKMALPTWSSQGNGAVGCVDMRFLLYKRSAAAVKPAVRDIGLRDFRRNFPDVEGVARVTSVVLAAARDPICQAQNLEIGLLSGKEVNLPGRIEVTEIIVGPDQILPRRDIAIRGATDLRYPDYSLVHTDIWGSLAIVYPRVAVEPGAGLARRDRRHSHRRRRWHRCAARRRKQKQTRNSL